MKNYFYLILLFLCFIACKQDRNLETPNVEIKHYEKKPDQIFKKTIHNSDFDSVYFYYDDGQVFKRGKQWKSGKEFGIWNYYDRTQNLREIREYFTVNNKTKINRVWFLNKKGDTLAMRYEDSVFKQSEFINDTLGFRYTTYNSFIFNKDTISLSEPIRAHAFCGSPLLRENNSKIKVYLAKEKINYNSDFSNENEVKFDVFYDLSKDSINQKWYPNEDFSYLAVFGRWFDTPGEKMLRGYMIEYSYGPFDDIKLDSAKAQPIYFEKKIFVRDTI